jgi:hypothetical protein
MTVDETYTETRYYKIDESTGSNQGYDALVELNTQFNVVENGANTPFINRSLYTFFDIETFKTGFSNIAINVPGSFESATDHAYNEFVKISESQYALGYFNDINGFNTEGYKLDEQVKKLAKKVTIFFIVSTALYALLYTTDPITDQQLSDTYSINLSDGPNITFTSSTHQALIEYLYYLYNHSIEDMKLNKPTDDDTYANHLIRNTTLNNMYQSQFTKLSEKQNNFDTKKAFVITMMAKAHKANKLYSRKKFWFTIYLSLLMLYIFGVIGVLYAASSSYEMFNMFQSSMIGFVMIVLNSIILTILFFYEISKYFYK